MSSFNFEDELEYESKMFICKNKFTKLLPVIINSSIYLFEPNG